MIDTKVEYSVIIVYTQDNSKDGIIAEVSDYDSMME